MVSGQRIFLIHWNESEAHEYAQKLRAQGWKVEIEAKDGARAAKSIKKQSPDAVVIYYTRLPSHGRATAEYLAEGKTTREIPIIFVGGEGKALEKSRAKLPQAIFTSEDGLESALEQLLETL